LWFYVVVAQIFYFNSSLLEAAPLDVFLEEDTSPVEGIIFAATDNRTPSKATETESE